MAAALLRDGGPQGPVPARSDVLFYEDGAAEAPFAGYRERFDHSSLPLPPLPVAYAFQPTATVRGPIVEGGAGTEADIEFLDALQVELRGAILMVDPAFSGEGASPTNRWIVAYGIAGRAAEAGCAAVLLVDAADDFVAPYAFVAPEAMGPPGRLALPVLPIRPADHDALLSRLRVRRVRGEDGQAVSLRNGPGPVEAAVKISNNLR